MSSGSREAGQGISIELNISGDSVSLAVLQYARIDQGDPWYM